MVYGAGAGGGAGGGGGGGGRVMMNLKGFWRVSGFQKGVVYFRQAGDCCLFAALRQWVGDQK